MFSRPLSRRACSQVRKLLADSSSPVELCNRVGPNGVTPLLLAAQARQPRRALRARLIPVFGGEPCQAAQPGTTPDACGPPLCARLKTRRWSAFW